MVKPHLRDIQYLHIKISKVDKERILDHMHRCDFYNISEFVRVNMLRLANEDLKKRSVLNE
jgi:hypothetical protein